MPDVTDLRRTTDSHTLIKGRRWRRTDPALGDEVRQHLVDELMHARRAVKAVKASDDPDDLAAARSRVNDAKVGLGERGPQWWTPMTEDDLLARCSAARRALVTAYGADLGLDDVAELLRIDPPSGHGGQSD